MKYKIKVTKKLIKQLKPYWERAKEIELLYLHAINQIEEEMSKDLGIEDLEIFHCDGQAGIGNGERSMRIIHAEELEKCRS